MSNETQSLLASRLDAIATKWSLVRNAHLNGKPEDATAARQALVLRYAKAVRRYVGGIIKQREDADELAQDVVVRLLKGDFCGADPNKGRFRDLLKTAVRNMVHNHWDKSNRRRPADVDLDAVAASAVSDSVWDNAWQQNVLDHAWGALKDAEVHNPNSPAYTLLKLRSTFPDASSEELAEKLGAKLGAPVRADACRQMLRRARVKFAEILIDEVKIGLENPTEERLYEEFAHLGLLEYIKDFLEK
jgi:DNA-directed RNA polymerase specialized sigma24 family protein